MRFQLFALGALALSWTLSVSAGEFVPTQQRAQGHSLTGSGQLNDSLYTNPAASSFTSVYAVDGTFLMPRSFAASILDTKTSDLGGALGYFRHSPHLDAHPLQGLKMAFSGKVDDTIAVGVGGKMIWGRDGQDNDHKLYDGDFGVLGNLGFLQLGFAVKNVLGGKPEIGQDREWSVGGRVNYEETLFLSVASTSRTERFQPYQYGIGAEYVSPWFLGFRGGYRIQPDVGHSYWSAGASFLSPRLSLHYAVEFPQQQGEKTEHVIGTTLLF